MSSSEDDDDEQGRIAFSTEGDYEDGQWVGGEFFSRGQVCMCVCVLVWRCFAPMRSCIYRHPTHTHTYTHTQRQGRRMTKEEALYGYDDSDDDGGGGRRRRGGKVSTCVCGGIYVCMWLCQMYVYMINPFTISHTYTCTHTHTGRRRRRQTQQGRPSQSRLLHQRREHRS